MVFDATISDLKNVAIEERTAAKGFLTKVLDIASKKSTVIITDTATEITALARGYIPPSASVALVVFDKLASGLEVQVEGELDKNVQVAFLHAADLLSTMIPNQDSTRVGLDTVAGQGKIGAQGSVNYDTPGVHLPGQAQDAIPTDTNVLDHSDHDPRAGGVALQTQTTGKYGEHESTDTVTPSMDASTPTTFSAGETDAYGAQKQTGQPGEPGHPGNPSDDAPHGLT